MRNGVAVVFLVTCLLGGTAAAVAAGPEGDGEAWIAVFPGEAEPVLHEAAVPVWDREEGVVIAGPSEEQLDVLRAQGVEPLFSAPDRGEGIYVLSHDRYFKPPVLAGLRRFKVNERAVLYLIPKGLEMDLPGLKLHALFHGVPRVALPPVHIHPADAGEPKALLTALPLVQQIVDATS